MNRSNLEKLAAYLESLPVDYEHFDMSGYNDIEIGTSMRPEDISNTCGAVACAVGHGPAAGIPIPEDCTSWSKYESIVFTDDINLWTWLFDCSWNIVDNTHHGAAARIRWLLDGGEIPNRKVIHEMQKGRTPLIYEVVDYEGS